MYKGNLTEGNRRVSSMARKKIFTVLIELTSVDAIALCGRITHGVATIFSKHYFLAVKTKSFTYFKTNRENIGKKDFHKPQISFEEKESRS